MSTSFSLEDVLKSFTEQLELLRTENADIRAQLNSMQTYIEGKASEKSRENSGATGNLTPESLKGQREEFDFGTNIFDRKRGPPRRETIFGEGVIRQQTVPRFESKNILDAPVNLLKVWTFLTEVKRYVLENPDATFRPQTYISTRAKLYVIGHNPTLREQDFDQLTEQALYKELLSVVKPESKKEFLAGFTDMVKYETSYTSSPTRKQYFQPSDYRLQHDVTKLVSNKAKEIFTRLCDMVHNNEHVIPSVKPDAQRPKESLIEAYESMLLPHYVHILKDSKKKAFHDCQWNFIDYVTLMEHMNQSTFLKMEAAIPVMELASSLNRSTRYEEENLSKLKMRVYREEAPRVQAIDMVRHEDEESLEHSPRHAFAGGAPLNEDEDMSAQVAAELADELSFNGTDDQPGSTFDSEIVASMERAVHGVRWASDKGKSAPGILKVPEGSKSICWHFLHSKGEGCPKGSSCPNSHDPRRIKEELERVTAFWNSK